MRRPSFSRQTLPFVCLTALALGAHKAQAGISVEVYGGSRQSSFDPVDSRGQGGADTTNSSEASDAVRNRQSLKFSGIEYGGSVMVAPLPLLPVSLGVFALQQELKGDSDVYRERLTGVEAGVVAMAWIDLGIVQPFGRLAYDAYSSHKYVAETEQQGFAVTGGSDGAVPTSVEMQGRVHGYHGAAGLRMRATPLVGAFLQADFARETFETDTASVKQAGFSVDMAASDVPKIQLNSRSFMVGVELGM